MPQMNSAATESMDALFGQLSKNFGTHLFEAIVDSKNDRSSVVAILLALGILAYAGVETVKLLFRKNFGQGGVSIIRLCLSIVAFVTITVVAYNSYADDTQSMPYGSRSSYLATAIFYGVLTIYITYKGFASFSKKALHQSYRGDSELLSFLMNDGWSQSKIQNWAEPLLLLSIGTFLTPINPLWGLPLMFCAISAWLHLLVEIGLGLSDARDILSNQGRAYSHNQKFVRAK